MQNLNKLILQFLTTLAECEEKLQFFATKKNYNLIFVSCEKKTPLTLGKGTERNKTMVRKTLHKTLQSPLKLLTMFTLPFI